MELQTAMVDPRSLVPHPDNPRGEIDANSVEIVNLANDIAKNGIIEPLVVTPDYKILAGHRRQVAAIRAGLAEVQVVFRELKGKELPEEIFYSENGHRKNLSPLEEARLFISLQKKYTKQWKRECTLKDLCRQVNVSPAIVRMRLVILDLPERVQQLFHIGEIPMNSASQLSRLKNWPDEIEKFADRLVTRQITLAGLDALITRRMKVLTQQDDAQAQLDREPRLEHIVRNRYSEGLYTPSLTRETVLENLAKSRGGRVAIFDVKVVMEATCCSCGMVGNKSVCLTCPLPRFVNGLIGRSDGGKNEV